MAPHKFFSVTSQGDVTIVRLAGPSVQDFKTEFRDELLAYLNNNTVDKLLINFEDVLACSSSVIGGLITAKQHLDNEGGKVKLCCMRESMLDKFKMLNLATNVFEIYDTEASALAAF